MIDLPYPYKGAYTILKLFRTDAVAVLHAPTAARPLDCEGGNFLGHDIKETLLSTLNSRKYDCGLESDAGGFFKSNDSRNMSGYPYVVYGSDWEASHIVDEFIKFNGNPTQVRFAVSSNLHGCVPIESSSTALSLA
ncbi:unnamed protein product [Cylicocyclus nassatus]|uniref:Uncharacterized protein n=1 Tax=Cylicocyclus nassatus TaxID=53992 RepID=A0AA36GJU1_CYLNA|nr:unnamed protein product [Cylicocyclus nassatus]